MDPLPRLTRQIRFVMVVRHDPLIGGAKLHGHPRRIAELLRVPA